MTSHIDTLDAALIALLREHPRIPLLEAARRLGRARGTVQARLARLEARGVITGHGPEVDPAAMGYPIQAFVFLELTQGRLPEAVEQLEAMPEILEVHAISGSQDLLCRLVARDPEHVQELVNRLLRAQAVRRSTSSIVLSTQIPPRTAPLVAAAGREAQSGVASSSSERQR